MMFRPSDRQVPFGSLAVLLSPEKRAYLDAKHYATVVNLIAKITTTTGLKVSCRLDRRRYPTGCRVSDEEWAKINLHRDDFHGDWNDTIRPRRKR